MLMNEDLKSQCKFLRDQVDEEKEIKAKAVSKLEEEINRLKTKYELTDLEAKAKENEIDKIKNDAYA